MCMRRDLLDRQGYLLRPASFRQGEAVSLVEGDAASQVRQSECALAISAIGGPDQVEQCFKFGDGKELSITKLPACRVKVAREHPDLTNVGLRHVVLL